METYLVGGAVRDQLLNYPHSEKDWVVVGATPEEMLAQGFQPVGKDFPVFLHPVSKEEYALARTERKTGPGYTGFDCYTDPSVTLEQDLLRRDLTINAMAQDQQGNLIDPYGGHRDLEAKTLRHVSPAFVEDPLRVLRVARFAARYAHLGFSVAEETMQLMQAIVHSGELLSLPAERIWKELEKALGEQSPQQFFSVLDQSGALRALMPELFPLNPATLSALAKAAQTHEPTTIRFALLFIDCDTKETDQLCHTIKAPNEYRQLAQLVSRLGKGLSQQHSDAESLLKILEAADAFRRPDRFAQLLRVGELLFVASASCNALRQALQASNTVDAKAVVEKGLKGKAIATELRRRRIAAIQSAN